MKWWRLLFRSCFPCLGMFKIVMQPTCREDCVQHFVCILVCLLTNILRLRNLQSQLKASPFQLRKRHVYLAYNVLTMIAIYWALPKHWKSQWKSWRLRIHQGFGETPTLYIILKCFEPLKLPWCFFQRHLPTTMFSGANWWVSGSVGCWAGWIDKRTRPFSSAGHLQWEEAHGLTTKKDRVSPDQVLQGGPLPVKSD